MTDFELSGSVRAMRCQVGQKRKFTKMYDSNPLLLALADAFLENPEITVAEVLEALRELRLVYELAPMTDTVQ